MFGMWSLDLDRPLIGPRLVEQVFWKTDKVFAPFDRLSWIGWSIPRPVQPVESFFIQQS